MGEALASFRELDGIGASTEARLHAAGVYSWSALAEVLGALRGAWVNGSDPLGELSDAAVARSADAGRHPDGERCEAFIVRLAVTGDGRPIRSAVTHVRSRVEQPWPGWHSDEVIRFIEERGRFTPLPSPATGAVAATAVAAPGRQTYVVELDAGKVNGGLTRDVDLRVGLDALAPGPLDYRAILQGRPYGPTSPATGRWIDLAVSTGTAMPPDDLGLCFTGVAFPAGVQRLRLRLHVRFPEPQAGPPTVALR